MTRRLLLVLLLTACTAGDDGAGTASPGDAPEGAISDRGPAGGVSDAPAIANTALPAGCEDLERTLPATELRRDSMRVAFGAPDSIVGHAQPNRHDPSVTDSLFVVYYPGMVAHIHTPGGANDMVTAVDITDNRYVAFPRLGIGAMADSLTRVLGTPTREQPSALVWDCGQEVEQPVRFELTDGRVRRIAIEYYVD